MTAPFPATDDRPSIPSSSSPTTGQPGTGMEALRERVFRLVALAEHPTWDRYTLGRDICHGIDRRVPEIIASVADWLDEQQRDYAGHAFGRSARLIRDEVAR